MSTSAIKHFGSVLFSAMFGVGFIKVNVTFGRLDIT